MTRRATLAVLGALVLAAAFPAASGSAVQRLDIRASVKMLPGGGATLIQVGTFSGRPLGRGSVRVRTAVGKGRGSVVSFRLSNARGSVTGRGDCAVTFKGSLILYRGVAAITGGTGAFRNIRGRNLTVSGRGELSSERFQVNLSGPVRT